MNKDFEGTLSAWATAILWIGLVAAVVLFFIAGNATKTTRSDDWGENGISPIYVMMSLGTAFQSLVVYLLFRGIAELIILLRSLSDSATRAEDAKRKP